MARIRLSRELLEEGIPVHEVRRMMRNRELQRIRRGAYLEPDDMERDARAVHLELLEATRRQSSTELVASHMSAAVIHSLPVWPDELARVHLTRDRRGGGQRRPYSEVHGLPLSSEDVVEVEGVLVTSLARTVVDLACALPMAHAVPIGDAALRRGLDRADLAERLAAAGQRSGVTRARRTVAFLDPRSESPGESFSRVVLHQNGVPTPQLQVEIFGSSGGLVGRSDFGWEEFRTLGEFDGRAKYGRLLRPGQTAGDAVFAEKVREDALRDLGRQVVRWIWADLYAPAQLLERLNRAFSRGRRAA